MEDAAPNLSELGHVVRLNIYRMLVKAGNEGMSVSEIKSKIGIPNSTLSHHTLRLVRVGLVTQTRESTVLRCRANYQGLNELVDFLVSECCSDENNRI